MRLCITIAACLLFVSVLQANPPGIPEFGDDFNVSGLFVENWEATRGAICADGQVSLPPNESMALRRIPEGDFAITADLTVTKPTGNDIGHCGVIIDKIHFMITPAGSGFANTAYRLPAEKRSRGKKAPIPGFEYGKPCRVMVTRQKLGEGYKYAYTANGAPIDSFFVVMPANARISFYGYKTHLTVDNFQLYSLKEDGSNNLVVNSSFEYLQEGMPNYMRPQIGGRFAFAGTWPEFIRHFAIDTEEKVSGKQCVRMDCPEGGPTSNGVSTYNVNVMANTPVTFSVYLKASQDDFPATLGIWELHHRNHTRGIVLSKEWKRYVFTLENPERATVRGSVTFKGPGTVWADDLQVEIGREATAYMPSSLDKDKYAESTSEEAAIEPDIVLQRAKRTPVIDGVIEDAWLDDATRVDAFFLEGYETPLNKTVAYLTCDADHLYLAVRAYVDDPAKVKGSDLEHDNLKVHGEDCIEVFLDTTFGRERYYHLTANAAGATTDMGPGRIKAWDGTWEVSTRINQDERSIDYEMAFPLALFADLGLADRWGVNIGRHDTERQEVYSLLHVKAKNFHVPTLFPTLVFPEGIMDTYRMGVKEAALVAGNGAGLNVAARIGNLSGTALDAEVKIIAAATGDLIGQSAVTLARGNTDTLISVNAAPGAEAIDTIVQIMVAGKERSRQPKRMVMARQLEIYTRYNYYMNEEAAVLVGTLGLPDVNRLTGRITLAGNAFDVALASEFAIDVPLQGIANGHHALTLDVFSGEEKLASASTTLIKRAFKEGATQIDHQRRCLVVDGKPYLVVAPFFGVERGIKAEEQASVLSNMLRLHKEMGYRCFLTGAVDDALVPQQAQQFIDLCAAEGIKTIYWPFQSWRRREAVTPEQRFEAVKSDSIIAHLIVDEPELYAKSDEVEAFMEAHRKLSPYTPVFMNNTLIGIPGRFAGLKTDILMLDDYLTNREGRKVIEMIDATDMMMEAGREERKPTFYFLAGENLHNHYREPTYAEQVAQTYGVIIAGARGVSYFTSLPLYPEDYRACVDVNRELLELEEVIFSLEKTSSATISDSAVQFMTRKVGDTIYVIALNTENDRGADVEIVLPAEFRYAEQGKVAFEDRQVAVRNGRIADRFAPLARHVYVATIME